MYMTIPKTFAVCIAGTQQRIVYRVSCKHAIVLAATNHVQSVMQARDGAGSNESYKECLAGT
jgi:hypothetical protein